MSHADATTGAAEPWGYLIKPDRCATDKLASLLLGIADYVSNHLEPKQTQCLVPAKLAQFYREVGGDWDIFFLDSPHSSISNVYRSLGCAHSLQPSTDDFAPPSIPALIPRGFVRWQTIQLLMDPDDHVRHLQDALNKWEILDPSNGRPFPKELPRTSFPERRDEEMERWHDMQLDWLKHNLEDSHGAGARQQRRPAPTDSRPGSNRPSREPSTEGRADSRDRIPHGSNRFPRFDPRAHVRHVSPSPTPSPFYNIRRSRRATHPRRRSLPDQYRTSSPLHHVVSPHYRHGAQSAMNPNSPATSDSSGSSTEDEREPRSETRRSPPPAHTAHFQPLHNPHLSPHRFAFSNVQVPPSVQGVSPSGRRHSDHRPLSRSDWEHRYGDALPPRQDLHFRQQGPLPVHVTGPPPYASPRPQTHWGGMDPNLGGRGGHGGETPPPYAWPRYVDARSRAGSTLGANRARGRNMVSPMIGVDGRRYPNDGTFW